MIVYTITLGEIVTTLAVLAGLVGAIVVMKVDVAVLKRDVEHLHDLLAPMRTWWDDKIIGRFHSDDELLHEKRGIENVLAFREEARERERVKP